MEGGRKGILRWKPGDGVKTLVDGTYYEEVNGDANGWSGRDGGKDANNEYVNGSAGKNDRIDERNGSSVTSDSRMAPLIAALPSQKREQEWRLEQRNPEVGVKSIWKYNANNEVNSIAMGKGVKKSNGNFNGNSNRRNNSNSNNNSNAKDQALIATALRTVEKDMSLLDNLASLQPQLSGTEVGLLLGAVVASGLGPIVFPGTSVTEVLAPAAAACESLNDDILSWFVRGFVLSSCVHDIVHERQYHALLLSVFLLE